MPELELFRGDYKTYPAKVSKSIWSPGGKLFFAAKAVLDTDATDTSAVIKKTLTDADITSEDASYKIYTLTLSDTDTAQAPGDYIGQFKYVDGGGHPTNYETFTFRIAATANNRIT